MQRIKVTVTDDNTAIEAVYIFGSRQEAIEFVDRASVVDRKEGLVHNYTMETMDILIGS